MRSLVGIIILSLVGFVAYKKFKKPQNSSLYFNLLQSQTEVEACKMESHCIVVYVAPWCPACHTFINFHKTYKALFKQKKLGIVYIVGADDSREKEENFRKTLADVAVVDTEKHDFMKIHKVKSFPKVWIIDKNGKVLKDNRAAHDFINEKLNQN